MICRRRGRLVAALLAGSFASSILYRASAADERSPISKPVLWGVGSATAAAWIIGGALGGVALSRESDQEGSPGAPKLYTRELKDSADGAKSLAIGAYVLFAVAGAGTVIEAVLLYERLHKPQGKPAKQAALYLDVDGVHF